MLRKYFCMFVAAVWSGVLFPFTLLVTLLTLSGDASGWITRFLWSPVLVWAGGGKLEVSGLENVDPRKPAIYLSNHQSTIDIPCLYMAVPVPFRWVAKRELKWVPFIGWYLAAAGHVFVDRSRRERAIASLKAAGEKIRRGTSIMVFPEGTRSDDLRILPFKKGPFALALEAGVPLIPIAVEGSGKLMPKNRWSITPGPIHVKIGKPIEPAEYANDDREQLMRRVRDAIIDLQLSAGGLGGDRENAIAAMGKEGVAKRKGKAA
jgi:1-acyl-sn-glycerol-3-phosphate acyltransferase